MAFGSQDGRCDRLIYQKPVIVLIYLLLSIIASTLIFVIFKLVEVYKLNTLHVIVINYITACLLGLYINETSTSLTNIVTETWFYGAMLLGVLFIIIFNVMAWTAQQNGLSVASVAGKMSVIIPVVFGIYVYNESYGLIKVLGILLALLAVYLTSVKSEKMLISLKTLWLPIVLFIGSGIIDTSIKYIQHHYLQSNEYSIFSSSIFLFAAVIGLVLVLINYVRGARNFSFKILPAGIFLGIVNYGSIYFLLKTLNFQNFESSTIFTVNNVAIVLLSTLVGLLLFREKLYPKNWVGITLAIVSIVMVSLV